MICWFKYLTIFRTRVLSHTYANVWVHDNDVNSQITSDSVAQTEILAMEIPPSRYLRYKRKRRRWIRTQYVGRSAVGYQLILRSKILKGKRNSAKGTSVSRYISAWIHWRLSELCVWTVCVFVFLFCVLHLSTHHGYVIEYVCPWAEQRCRSHILEYVADQSTSWSVRNFATIEMAVRLWQCNWWEWWRIK